MKRFFISSIALLLCFICLNAQRRSEGDALRIAKEFYSKKGRTPLLTVVPNQKVDAQIRKMIVGARLIPAKNQSFYVVNDETNNRFVIVSADERFYTILGYSNNGLFDASTAPHALLELLDGYNNQYEYMLKYEANAPRVGQRKTDFPDLYPDGLIQSRWGQGSPYNDDCPISTTKEKRCVTGCVATAMAQVMRYHRWPVAGQGNYTYIVQIDSTQSETMEMDFSTIHFNWDNLLDSYSGETATVEQKAEVAKLMKACGISVAMNYGTWFSGSQEQNIAYALTHYFDYNPNILYKCKKYYSIEEWDEMILGELKAGRPVLYEGNSGGRYGGHSFILDGCASDGTYHFNFGWEGYSDGNFHLEGTDRLLAYSGNQGMVYQVDKAAVGMHEDIFYCSEFKSQKTIVKIGEASKFSFFPYCYSTQTSIMDNIEDSFAGEVGIAIYDKDFNFIQSLYSKACENIKWWGSPHVNESITFSPAIFENGHEYVIAPYAKGATSSTPTRIRTSQTTYDYYVAKVENDSVKLWVKGEKYHKIPVGIYKASAVNDKGETMEWFIKLKSKGESDYDFTITNLDPCLSTAMGNGLTDVSGTTNTTGILLTLSYYSNDWTMRPMLLETDEDLTINYNTETGVLSINGEWGSVRKTKEDNETRFAILSRYSNTSFTYMSPEETAMIIKDNKVGDLSSHFAAPIQYFTDNLTVSGNLNGTDIKYLRSMMKEGSLDKLNIEEASITTGGESYFSDYSRDYFTQNDTIGIKMFYDCKNLTSIKLPNSLKAIDEYAFGDCKNLESIQLPETMDYIGSSAFSGCSSLKALDIPEGVRELPYSVLSSCESLQSLKIPSSIQYINDNAFSGSHAICAITCNIMNINRVKPYIHGTAGNLEAFNNISDNCIWHIVSGKADLYKAQTWWKDSWTLVEDLEKPYEEELNIPDNNAGELVLRIPEVLKDYYTSLKVSGELNGTDIKQILEMLTKGMLSKLDISDSHIVNGGESYVSDYSMDYFTHNDTIGVKMFNGCKNLISIKLPNSLKAIDEYAFNGCKNLESIQLPETMDYIGSSAFSGCSSLKAIDIPEGVRELPYSVLSSCESLQSLKIPSSIQYINDNAFSGSHAICAITCNIMNINRVKPYIHGTAGNLEAFNNISDNCIWHIVSGKADLYKTQTWWKDSWTVVEDLEKPYEDAFVVEENIAGELFLSLPSTLTDYISSLKITGQLNGTDIKLIRQMLTDGCLSSLDLQDASIVAGGEAYHKSWSSEYYTRENTIGRNMFENSQCLTNIILPHNLSIIEEDAFYGCSNLCSLDIPKDVARLESGLLRGCDKLSKLTIPSFVNYINDYSLSGCHALDTIFCFIADISKVKASDYGSNRVLNAFEEISDTCKWHVVEGTSGIYIAQSWWKNSWTIIDDLITTQMQPSYNYPNHKDVWYSIDGKRLNVKSSPEKANKVVEGLSKGVYIVNGQKLMLR